MTEAPIGTTAATADIYQYQQSQHNSGGNNDKDNGNPVSNNSNPVNRNSGNSSGRNNTSNNSNQPKVYRFHRCSFLPNVLDDNTKIESMSN